DLGRYDEAATHFEYVLDHFPDAASIRNDYGTDLLLLGRPRDAVRQYVLAFPAAAGLPSLQGAIKGNLGLAQERVGEPDSAIESYREALAIDSSLYKVHASFGMLLLQRSQLDEAMHEFQESLHILPSALAYYGEGRVFQDEHRNHEA